LADSLSLAAVFLLTFSPLLKKIVFMKKVTIYTDGACSGNPGPGGYGVILQYAEETKEISAGFANTTNNRMEMMAVIAGLSALKEPCDVTVVTDSRYVVDAIEKGWVQKWQKNSWMRNKKEKALNVDLWKKLLQLMDKHHVTFTWVRGHNHHPQNERCDQLAVAAAAGRHLVPDIRRR
jgi:ribonuclease HI